MRCVGGYIMQQPCLNDLKLQFTIGGVKGEIPKFVPSKTDYDINVQSDIANVAITPIADLDYSISINDKPVKSGETNIEDIITGDNKFEIKLQSIDKNSKTYTVNVFREDIQSIINKFKQLSFTDPKTRVTLKYNLFIPDDYDPNVKYPLVFFLHGAGERGEDLVSVLTANEGATIWAKEEEQKKRPCFIVAPQCPEDKGWTSLMSAGFDDAYRLTDQGTAAFMLVKEIVATYNIDKCRIYSTGVSMGGFGVWALNIKNPYYFAALVPICSYGDTSRVYVLDRKPIWYFTANKDEFVKIEKVQQTIKALEAADGRYKYTEYPEDAYFFPFAHFSWVPTYSNEEMREWMFEQRLF